MGGRLRPAETGNQPTHRRNLYLRRRIANQINVCSRNPVQRSRRVRVSRYSRRLDFYGFQIQAGKKPFQFGFGIFTFPNDKTHRCLAL